MEDYTHLPIYCFLQFVCAEVSSELHHLQLYVPKLLLIEMKPSMLKSTICNDLILAPKWNLNIIEWQLFTDVSVTLE